MIKQVLENAIANIQSQRNAEIENAKNTAIREKVNPFNAEIDNAYQSAICELQAKFEDEKRQLCEAGNIKKKENQEKVLNEVVNAISYKYDIAISKLKKQIEEVGE